MPEFSFKQFLLTDDGCAMKIGTDAVLLGAWVGTQGLSGKKFESILDVGTGCGIIALMMAQRTDARVDAVEIDSGSCSCCTKNFSNSPWSGRLEVFQDDFISFSANTSNKYDLIICNPPYFTDSLKNPDPQRAIARHDIQLGIRDLFTGSYPILNDDGIVAIVYPFLSFSNIRQVIHENSLHIKRITHILSAPGKNPVRVLVELCKKEVEMIENNLFIRNEDGSFSDMYKTLTKEFYLAF